MTLSPESHLPDAAVVIISGGLDSTTLVYHSVSYTHLTLPTILRV